MKEYYLPLNVHQHSLSLVNADPIAVNNRYRDSLLRGAGQCKKDFSESRCNDEDRRFNEPFIGTIGKHQIKVKEHLETEEYKIYKHEADFKLSSF